MDVYYFFPTSLTLQSVETSTSCPDLELPVQTTTLSGVRPGPGTESAEGATQRSHSPTPVPITTVWSGSTCQVGILDGIPLNPSPFPTTSFSFLLPTVCSWFFKPPPQGCSTQGWEREDEVGPWTILFALCLPPSGPILHSLHEYLLSTYHLPGTIPVWRSSNQQHRQIFQPHGIKQHHPWWV